MKQLLQQPRTGAIRVEEVPAPKLLPGCVLVRIAASLVSAGTERAVSEFARKTLPRKAWARPDLVREVLTKARRDGVLSAFSTVNSRLDQPAALGYSSAGTVLEVGEGLNDLSVGDHVACSGADHAIHGEFACVPRLLVARVPMESSVTPEEACFSTLGGVALHGIRTSGATLGDVVAVIGLGLLGQLTVQLLKAAGCTVVGMDIDSQRVELARRLGADAACASDGELRDLCIRHSSGNGADAAIITAETSSSGPVNLAGEVCRDRGTVVAVGTVGMEIDRKIYYRKELDFRISRSYGPGRYDAAYEQQGRDYPIGYVRWTETRNLEAFIHVLAEGKVDVRPLITHRFPLSRAPEAYELINRRGPTPFLGVLITYAPDAQPTRELRLMRKSTAAVGNGELVSIGVLGAGNFATTILLPAIKHARGVNVAVCAASGSHARYAAQKFGFLDCTTDEENIFADSRINTVVIATRHHLHAQQVMKALAAGKHVFCEKPLCLTEAELSEIVGLHMGLENRPLLLIGFNRRFSPMARQMKAFLDGAREPLAMHYRINAGPLPTDHWVNDPEQGGGRLLGEACHFIDFLSFLAGSHMVEVQTQDVASPMSRRGENVIIGLKCANGSHGTISYLSNGDRAYSKERIEVFAGGSTAVLDDFRRLELVGHGRKRVFKSRFRQDKGHRAEIEAFFAAIRNGDESPISVEDIVNSTLTTLCAEKSRRIREPVATNFSRLRSM